MRPVVHGLEDEYGSSVRVVVLDYDVREELRKAQALNANYHPALVFLRPDGSVLLLVIGYMSPERIRRNVDELLGL
jgi:F plasmid transfer operon protein